MAAIDPRTDDRFPGGGDISWTEAETSMRRGSNTLIRVIQRRSESERRCAR